jgi:antitoxin ParD1/3/4
MLERSASSGPVSLCFPPEICHPAVPALDMRASGYCQFLPITLGLDEAEHSMPTRNINLTDHFDAFVESSIASGRYKNASEVVREGLRLLEQRQAEDTLKLDRLREAVRVGEEALERGDFDDVELDDLASYLASLGTTARRRAGA